MIHGNSNDPVLIKKIKLRIWHLRDEIEATIKARGTHTPKDEINLDDLHEEYKYKGPLPRHEGEAPDLKVVPDGEEAAPEGEAPAEAAEGEAPASEETSPEGEETTEEGADNVLPIVRQRIPELDPEKVFLGTAVLAELDIDHLYLFTNKKFIAGQSIVIEFLVPKRFVVNADVIFCREYNMKSRIISDVKLPYRTGVNFTFLKEGERTLLRNFIKSVEPSIPEPQVDMKKVAKKEDDDFDELDDFDL